jgi:hypothetical protein
MSRRHLLTMLGVLLVAPLLFPAFMAAGRPRSLAKARIEIEPGHPWRPPFGLERVGRALEAVVTFAEKPPAGEFVLAGYGNGKEVSRQRLTIGEKPFIARACLEACPAAVALLFEPAPGAGFEEVTRKKVTWPAFEAEAVARPDRMVNPVDLGTILVPADWLLLAGGQKSSVEVAALQRSGGSAAGRATAWYESAPRQEAAATMPLAQGHKAQVTVTLGPCSQTLQRDVLHVAIKAADGKELWQKQIRVMIVPDPPKLPAFGAVETKLRYDAPISVRKADGTFTSLAYANAWDPKLHDVVVAMPNGSRFVFWRGSCYIPFWAGRHNTGFCYEWAENTPPPDATDCVEPLMDKELRYSRVRIIESTAARVHVRWTYQSCDFNYKTWGDSVVEDFYFYPDGFGTRVLTLQCDPRANYELSELIELTPQSTYPLSVLPPNLLDILFVDGQKRGLTLPLSGPASEKMQSRGVPAIFRVRLDKDDPTAAIYFSPLDKTLPQDVYGPFYDKGQMVTPVYWGSHWPLARGNVTGGAINDRFSLTPAHNSIITWGFFHRPTPVRTAHVETLDTLGRSKPMLVQTWAWLIGMSDADDARLLQWARSFTAPPSVQLHGALLDPEPYVPERRAIRLIAEDKTVTITIKPAGACVNPVFELTGAPKKLVGVRLADRVLNAKDYAWDGRVLWLNTTIVHPVRLRLEFVD